MIVAQNQYIYFMCETRLFHSNLYDANVYGEIIMYTLMVWTSVRVCDRPFPKPKYYIRICVWVQNEYRVCFLFVFFFVFFLNRSMKSMETTIAMIVSQKRIYRVSLVATRHPNRVAWFA